MTPVKSVKVYCFMKWDPITQSNVMGERMATRAAIRELGAMPIDTASWAVDPGQIDADGFLLAHPGERSGENAH